MRRATLLGIVVLVTLVLSCAVSNADPLQNASFESGTLEPGWSVSGEGTYSGWVTGIGPHTDGSNHAYIEAFDEYFPDFEEPELSLVFPSNVRLTQTFDVSALAQSMSIDIAYSDSSALQGGIIEVYLEVSGGTAIDFAVNPSDELFHTYSADISAAAGNTATIRLEISSPYAGEFEFSSMAVDNIVITEVPEPATLSLLALGGMGLLRRRRTA